VSASRPPPTPPRQPHRCLGRLAIVLIGQSKAAAPLWFGCRRRLRPGKPLRRRVFAPSRRPLTSPPSFRSGHRRAARVQPLPTSVIYARELGCVALFHTGEASAMSPFLAPFTASSSCRHSGAVTRARAGAVHHAVELPTQRRRHACSCQSRARRWATRLGRPKPSWARSWATRAAQAGCAGAMPLGHTWIRPSDI
jgi:hypothetical protein